MNRMMNPCEMIEKNAEKFPQRVAAVQANGEYITYEELLVTVSKVGSCIYHKYGATGKPVIVLCDRSIWTYIVLLSVAWAGCFYCPLDGKTPEFRLNAISEILDHPIVMKGNREIVYELAKQADICRPWKTLISRDLLYVMFTSGSTGIPKGVAVRIEAAMEMTEAFSETIDFPDPLILGNQAPFDFDVSTKDIYLALAHAGTLGILPAAYFAMTGNLVKFLNENSVNTLIWAVSAMRVVENFKAFDGIELDSIKLVMFSGETMYPRVMRYWQRNLPDCTFVNLYGPTEVTGNCTYYKIEREFLDEEKIPIGKSFHNFHVMLLSEEGQEIFDSGIEGEICVRGLRTAAGYYNNPEQTKRVFLSASSAGLLGDIVYHTGDVGRYDESGNLIFCGRKDHQIKYMGHRIELGEIEAVCVALSEINLCCAFYDQKSNRIVLAYESNIHMEKELKESLSLKLPRFMIPSVYCRLDKIPQTAHGKCDRIALRKMMEEIEDAE